MDPFTTDRWAEIDALFAEALERPPDERTAFLRAACGGDPVLYRAVVTLLDSDAAAERALGEHATEFAAHLLDAATEPVHDLPPGTRVGPYRIEGELGRGGMGTVYRAARADGTFEKAVALKLVRRGMDTDEVLRRFRYERQILAGLDHPHIARLLDAGAADDGRPFLVMELAEGEPITRYAEQCGLDVEARLALFEQVCEAVAYAHRHLVVHRDLKPSNVLVTERGGGPPQVKLLDFGIARLLDDEAADAPRTTSRPDDAIAGQAHADDAAPRRGLLAGELGAARPLGEPRGQHGAGGDSGRATDEATPVKVQLLVGDFGSRNVGWTSDQHDARELGQNGRCCVCATRAVKRGSDPGGADGDLHRLEIGRRVDVPEHHIRQHDRRVAAQAPEQGVHGELPLRKQGFHES